MKRIFLFTTTLFIAVCSWSKPISLEEAFGRVCDLQKNLSRSGASASSLSNYELIAERGLSYILSDKEGGYLILPADDRLPAVLGFSDSGTLTKDNIPPAMSWWLEQLSNTDNVYSDNFVVNIRSEYEDEKVNIPPLLNTAWGQGSPYNLTCPQISDHHTLTGCIATAMAQIMKHYNYPAQGKQSYSYQWNGESIDTDFSNYIFDWDSMLPQYVNGAYSEQQGQAVAQLMEACGKSVLMNYGLSESGTSEMNVQYALPHFFSYDPMLSMIQRTYNSDSEWEEILYEELSENRPVLYSGTNSSGDGHAFVCDGYMNGYFHFNWGWDGASNGYFLISPMRLNEIEYGHYETAIIGISPYPSKDKKIHLNAIFNVNMENIQASEDEPSVLVFRPDITFINPYEAKIELLPGIRIISEDGGVALDLPYPDYRELGGLSNDAESSVLLVNDIKIAINQDKTKFDDSSVIHVSLDNGSYRISPIFSLDGSKWQAPKMTINSSKYYSFSINHSEIGEIKGEGRPDSDVVIIGCTTLTTPFAGEPFTISTEILNKGDLESGTVEFTKEIYDESGSLCWKGRDIFTCGLFPGAGGFELEETSGLPAGEYMVRYTELQTPDVTYEFPITIHAKEEIIESEGKKYIFLNDEKSRADHQKRVRMIADSETVYKGQLEIPATITVNGEECEVVEIDRGIILNNRKLTGITMKALLFNEIPEEFFANLSIDNVELPEGVTAIGAKAFEKCLYLMDVTLPSTLKNIGVSAFAGCKSLDNIILNAEIPPVLSGASVFSESLYKYATVTVPENAIEAYQDAPIWRNFECLKKVDEIPAVSISLDHTEVTLEEGESITIAAIVSPDNATDKTVTWSSSTPAIASVSADGFVVALKVGTATVTASTQNGLSASCIVTVNAKIIPVVSITFDNSEVSLEEGENIMLSAKVSPDNATDKSLVWSSSDVSIVTVTEDGKVTALRAGDAVIIATAGDNSGVKVSCNVHVNAKFVPVESLTIHPTEWNGIEGESFSIIANILPEMSSKKALDWSSSNETVATVDSSGLVKVIKEGNCTIAVKTTDGSNIYAECIITSKSGIDDIIADGKTFSIYSPHGILIKTNCKSDDLTSLSAGVYILHSNGKSVKIVIR